MNCKKIGFCSILSFFLIGCSGTTQTTPPPPPPISLSVTPGDSIVGPGQTAQLTANVQNSTAGVTWGVNNVAGGNATVGTIDAQGKYTAPNTAQSVQVTITATSKEDTTKSASASVVVVVPGTVGPTNNPQVALYTIAPPVPGKVSVEFGLDTSYGLNTWQVNTPQGGGATSVYVAGMKVATTYHMRAKIELTDGTTFADADHTFTTGTPTMVLPTLTATTTPGRTPQSGIEVLDLIGGSGVMTTGVSDLNGNILWAYPLVGGIVQPIKQLSDGNFLISFGPSSVIYTPASSATPDTTADVREVDLGGNTIKHITPGQLNDALAANGISLAINTIHHDVLELPNGHWIVIANTTKSFTDLPGFPGTTNVLGDVLVDLDQNLKPVWTWSTFDHLDVNRHPMAFPDWTHSNALLYSPDDGNLLLSIRHQHWIVKIDYKNGTGTGDILWKLGAGGDFTLVGGTDPVDWFYAQHKPTIISPNSTGVFELAIMDNGDNRPSLGTACGSNANPCYTTVPILQVDETQKTATVEFRDTLPPAQYSNFGGNAELLGNGNVEFDLASQTPGSNGAVYEVTKEATPQVVWTLQITGQTAYRAFRIPSFYPGVN